MQKKLIIKQHGIKDCGACALLSIIRYYDGNISITKLLELTNTNKNGTTFYDLKIASSYLGLSAVGYKIEKELPKNTKVPFICQIINNNYTHFIVVYQIKNNKVLIMDPAKGKRILKLNEFYQLWTGYIMIFDISKKIPYLKDNNYIKEIILKTLKKNKKNIIFILILSIIYTILTILNSYQLKFLLDTINFEYTIDFLKEISIIFLIIIILRSLTNLFRNQLLIYLNEKIDINLFTTTIKNILYLPYNYYKNKTTGEVTSKISDISYIRNIVSKITLTVLLDIILFITCGITLYLINSKLFIIAIIIICLYVIILIIFNPIINKKVNIDLENNAILNSNLIENISSFETIKGLNIENNINSKLEYLYAKSLNNICKFNVIINVKTFLKETIGLIGLLFINVIGIKEIADGNILLSNLIVFNNILLYFLDPIKNFLELSDEYYLAINSLKRANTLYEIEPENFAKNTDLEVNGNINITNLNFSYGHLKVLKNINLNIKDKEKVLILGNSGSGKSTLLKILYKYYQIERNKIRINNYDINDFSLADIRKEVLYISQNEMLYTNSIRNNIILKRNITEKEFLSITDICQVDKIIDKSILGYDMLLEENGINISGGERQRIILARSMLKNSKLILIDEGLNQIDINLERKILERFFKYYHDKTFIIVSHRLDNIDLYDKVVKMKNGEILEVLERNENDIQ